MSMGMKKQKNPNTLTLKESRAIIKSNLKEMKRLGSVYHGHEVA